MRKMLVAMAKDLRVLIIKLADRLHNMRTIAAMPARKQERTAQETLDIYAPLAHRLGMQEMKQQLEDLAFAALHPKRYAEIDHMVSTRSPERDDLPRVRCSRRCATRLAELRIDADVTGRPKHLWSIYEKMVVKGKRVRRDLRPRRHPGHRRHGEGLLRRARLDPRHVEAGAGPVQGLHRDAQVQPLPVAAHDGGRARRASRSRCRSAPARCTSAPSSASPPTGATRRDTPAADIAWLNRIVDWQQETSDPAQFMENLKIDLEQDEVFVFTPKGRGRSPCRAAPRRSTSPTRSTPRSGTPASARGSTARLVPLDSTLLVGRHRARSSPRRSRAPAPSRDWLKIVVSPRARNKIRQWFSRERREDAIETGRESSSRRCAARACRCRSS